MVRKVIKIDEEKCNGCGACANACHEGAIGMVDGKARLLREDYCDGLGDCLPSCPAGAITFEEREALAYDEKAATASKVERHKKPENSNGTLHHGCPGSASRAIRRDDEKRAEPDSSAAGCIPVSSRLSQWPVQIKLVPVKAPYFDGAGLLVAADCTAYAYGSFHNDFIKNRVTVIGCPKLDMVDYTEKLTQILSENDIKSLTIVRMEVPCCGGIENAAKQALKNSGKFIPWSVVTISTDGRILE